MTDTNETTHMKDDILGKIRLGELSMRPKMYFTLQMLTLGFVAFMTLVVSVLVCTFIFFSLRLSGHESLLWFGPRGILFFFTVFPWLLLLLDIALVLFLQKLLRQFRFGYKSPVLFLIGGLIVVTASVGLVLDRHTPFNDRILRGADARFFPGPINDFYEGARRPLPPGSGVCRCIITAIEGNSLTVYNPEAGTTTFKVLTPPGMKNATSGLMVGDVLFIAGDRVGNTIRAFGINKFPPEWRQ